MTYPILRILAGIALLAVMWEMIFDISAMQVGKDMETIMNDAVVGAVEDHELDNDKEGSVAASRDEAAEEKADAEINATMGTLLGHTKIPGLLLFFVLNALIGVFSTGALTSQALSIARKENRSIGAGYATALLRLPQLVCWWVVTVIVGFILSMLESHKALGAIISQVIGAIWKILTFFAIAAIMAKGCWPIGAIGQSKQTIVDTFKRRGELLDINGLQGVRHGVMVAGPIMAIWVILHLLMMGLLFLDWRSLHHGGHGMTAGAFGALLLVSMMLGTVRSALWAIFKSFVWVWAEEGTVPAPGDEAELEKTFTDRNLATA